MKKAKEEGVNTSQIVSEFIEKLISKIENIIEPFKEFVDKIFEGNEKIEAYKLYKNVLIEGYNIARKKGIENYKKIKIFVDEKYTGIKNKYLNKKKKYVAYLMNSRKNSKKRKMH